MMKAKLGSAVKRIIAEERRKLRNGFILAKVQWQLGQNHQDRQMRKYDIVDILERRYMFLYKVAKKRKLHALE